MRTIKTFLLLLVFAAGFTTVKADPIPLRMAINNVTKAYLSLKDALAANNAGEAQNKAMDLVRALNAVPDVNMSSDQHRLWFDYLSKLVFDARHINESGSIDHQREHFNDLSDNMFTVLKKFAMNNMTLYKQYSPSDRFYWISETESIKNPYQGKGSSGFIKGEIRETLRAH